MWNELQDKSDLLCGGPLSWYFQLCKSARFKHRDCRNYRLLTDFSALNAFPCSTEVREFALVPIGNLKCNYPSFQSASGAWHLHLPLCLSSLLPFLSLSLSGCFCMLLEDCIFSTPAHFLSTTPTITYVNDSGSDRRFTEPPLLHQGSMSAFTCTLDPRS